MYKSLILVSKKPIVIQIFTLVCRKLNIKLEILSETQIDSKVDIIVMDSEFIDDRYNIIKGYSKLIGVISQEELPFEIANDFIIPLPFLPSSLQEILEKQLTELEKRQKSKIYARKAEPNIEDNIAEEDIAANYLESLAEDIAVDIVDEDDESIVPISSIDDGGILDTRDLSQIEDLIAPDNATTKIDSFVDFEVQDDDSKWLDLSSIIDQAISEVNATGDIYLSFNDKPIKLVLNDYKLEQLTPLLNLLDQSTINSLTQGQDVALLLKFEDNNG